MPCSAHNLIKLHIADGLVRIPAGWSESCYIRFPEGERQPLEDSLNAGVSCWKDRFRSNLGEQVHQVRDPPTIELLHRFDEPASEILIREWFTQPMKFLHGPVPRHRIGQTSLVAQLFFHENPLVFSEDRDSGIKFFGITSGETLIGTDLHSRKQRLRIRRLNACRLQLRWPHLIVEQSRCDEVFEIVLGLLFALGMIRRTIATTSREIERSLEDFAVAALDICRLQPVE